MNEKRDAGLGAPGTFRLRLRCVAPQGCHLDPCPHDGVVVPWQHSSKEQATAEGMRLTEDDVHHVFDIVDDRGRDV